ncbi:unnamed protein product [Lasius platythorax]|uniref:Uncharacterized protein n=1 Tax=Lasius platythorax TaxID=488582 RepID=A0AAV2MWP2_9HYME
MAIERESIKQGVPAAKGYETTKRPETSRWVVRTNNSSQRLSSSGYEVQSGISSICQNLLMVASIDSTVVMKERKGCGPCGETAPIKTHPKTVLKASGSPGLPFLLPSRSNETKTSAPSKMSIEPGK